MKILTWLVLVLGAACYIFDVVAWRTTGNWDWISGAIPLAAAWVFCYTMYLLGHRAEVSS